MRRPRKDIPSMIDLWRVRVRRFWDSSATNHFETVQKCPKVSGFRAAPGVARVGDGDRVRKRKGLPQPNRVPRLIVIAETCIWRVELLSLNGRTRNRADSIIFILRDNCLT